MISNSKLKLLLFFNFLLSFFYILLLNPWELSDESTHFFRSLGSLFFKKDYLVDEKYVFMCEIYDCDSSLYKNLFTAFSSDVSFQNNKVNVDLQNIRPYFFVSYIFQKLITSTLHLFFNNPLYIYFFGKVFISLINFTIIYHVLKKIRFTKVKYFLIFVINFPLSLMLLGSYSQDMYLIIVSILIISILDKNNTTLNFFLLNFFMLLLSIGKIPYGIFFFISFLIVKNHNYNLKYILTFIIFFLLFLFINIINLNNFELTYIKRPGINFSDHISYIETNFLEIPSLLILNFVKNSWTYSQQVIGYYSPGNIFYYPWNLIIYPFVMSFQVIFLIFLFNNFKFHNFIILILFILSIIFLALVLWFGISYPHELSNIHGLDGRYYLINLFLFSYYFIYKNSNKHLSESKLLNNSFLIFLIGMNLVNLANLFVNKLLW
jgi:hypothetical protein